MFSRGSPRQDLDSACSRVVGGRANGDDLSFSFLCLLSSRGYTFYPGALQRRYQSARRVTTFLVDTGSNTNKHRV